MENKIYLFHSTMAWRFLEILLVDFYYEKGRILHVCYRIHEKNELARKHWPNLIPFKIYTKDKYNFKCFLLKWQTKTTDQV